MQAKVGWTWPMTDRQQMAYSDAEYGYSEGSSVSARDGQECFHADKEWQDGARFGRY